RRLRTSRRSARHTPRWRAGLLSADRRGSGGRVASLASRTRRACRAPLARPAHATSASTLPHQTMSAATDIITALGFAEEIDQLRQMFAERVALCSAEMRPIVEWQFAGKSKYFRPLTVFCCHRALSDEPIPSTVVRSATVVEMFHNVSLIIDDILDQSNQRRGRPTLHRQFGVRVALMGSGDIVAGGYGMGGGDRCVRERFLGVVNGVPRGRCL